MGARIESKGLHELVLVVHMCNPTTLKAEAGGSQVLTGQPRLQTKILFKFKKEKREKKSEPWPLKIRQRLHQGFNTEDICKIKQTIPLVHENAASSRKALTLEQNSAGLPVPRGQNDAEKKP